MAAELIAAEGASTSSPTAHWQVIHFMRDRVLREGHRRRPSASSARPRACRVKELYQLFPKGPAKIAAKIAGIPKPRGCI